jgi:hypothetical protein
MRRPSTVLLAILFSLLTGYGFAQSEKLSITFVPIPNQTFRLINTQEKEVQLSWEGNGPDQSFFMKPTKVMVKLVMEMIYKTGPIDKDGRVELECTIDKASAVTTFNDEPHPEADEAQKLIGSKFKIIFDGKGKPVDIQHPKIQDYPPELYEPFTRSIKSFFDTLTIAPMSIGDYLVFSGFDIYPIPMISERPTLIPFNGTTKLIALDKEPAGRIAKFVINNEGKLTKSEEIELAFGKVLMSADINLNGSGNSRVNIDKVILRESEYVTTIGGKITFQMRDQKDQLPHLILKGSSRVTYTGTN